MSCFYVILSVTFCEWSLNLDLISFLFYALRSLWTIKPLFVVAMQRITAAIIPSELN